MKRTPPHVAVAAALAPRFAPRDAERLRRGLAQVAGALTPADVDPDARTRADGDTAVLRRLAEEQFVPEGPALDALFARLRFAFERVDGYFVSLGRDLRRGVDVEDGPQLPVDGLLAGWDPSAHLADDMFRSRIAFVALLNFPESTLAQRIAEGGQWSRRQWAETRLAGRFEMRVPADVNQEIARAMALADEYVSGYNIRMHHVLTPDGKRLFPAGLRLISHWNLRDEIKAAYAEKDGLAKQRLVQLVMEKIVRQEIPQGVIDDPRVDWTPATGAVALSPVKDGDARAATPATASPAREPDTRYRHWLDNFRAIRRVDAFDPLHRDVVQRSFEREREIPEADVRALFEAVLDAPAGAEVGRLVAQRLGRPLEPFDVWYAGFRPRARFTEAELDAKTRARYPDAQAFAADMPRILEALGFAPDKARFVAAHVVVDPSRGAGHASGGARRDDEAHLRTRVGANGMDYKGYNIAVHEFGHNVEQVFSNVTIDDTLLRGVPNSAFTEALAFLFQDRDLELLGLGAPTDEERRLLTLDAFWATREIAGVALVDIDAWHWMVAHPDATPAQLREAVVSIADRVWNRWYAPILGRRDVPLLAIYSHMVSYPLYTPDYPLGHLIAFQVGEHFRTLKDTAFGAEFERVAKIGSVTPDLWMRTAVGAPLSAAPLLRATEAALAGR